jgi:hypothetical protein
VGGKRIRRGLLCAPVALLALGSSAVSANAETHSFTKIGNLSPSEIGATSGPATQYPSSIVVSGLSGTVTKVTATMIGLNSASGDDIDAVLSGPNGQNVMLMSDACGVFGDYTSNNFTFDDAAPGFVSNNGPCLSVADVSLKPSNYLGNAPEPDDLGPSGGPAPPYLNAMSFLAGGSPNGAWRLFMLDDDAGAGVGFDLPAWALTLEVQPPPTVAPANTVAPAAKKCKKQGKGKKGAAAPSGARAPSGAQAARKGKCGKKK